MRWLSGNRVRGTLGAALAVVVGTATLVQLGEPAEASAEEPYLVGRGTADVTGEAAERGMMGYARLDQRTSGIHQRQRSRAFIIADRASGKRVVLVTADLGMIFGSVRQAVLRKLAARYGSLYTPDNVLLTATHTHSGPGGQSHYSLYNITTFGYHGRTFDATVDGIVESISRAHDDLAPGSLSLATGELRNASVNRSRRAFDNNPAQDRAAFPDGIDPMTTLLRMDRGGRTVGAINWFATHETSMTGDNTLISGDNKGYAAYHWEREVAGVDYLAGQPGLVTAFAQTNAGDMSPNLNLRPGSGPTEDEFANTQIIGRRQADAARALAATAGRELSGGVDFRLSYVDMSDTTVRPEFTGDGMRHRTCQAALGASFAAGSTEDGPGPDIFREGVGNNPLIELVTKARYVASPKLRACQAPKDILLDTGALNLTPKILPIQLVRIGQLYLIGLPQEVTIVSGLRLRRTVAEQVGAPLQNVLVAGYANDYAGYLTTPEEYDQQEYEGGHTMFGRWSLPAYQQEFARIAADMKAGRPSATGPTPPDMSGSVWTLQPGVVLDAPPIGGNFGDVVTAPKPSYTRGQQVLVEFAGAHPNNDLHRNGTFVEVQRQEGTIWKRVADDGDWSTKFRWARWGVAASRITVSWDVPSNAQPGTYRIVYRGDAKSLTGGLTPFIGTSPVFTIS